MSELIPINKNENGELLVSARDLYEFLEIKTEFRKWLPRMIEYGFEENIDFTKLSQKCPTSTTGQSKVDYALKIDMAKEIAMIQWNDKGKQARKYFIECEKKLKQQTTVPQLTYDEEMMIQAHRQILDGDTIGFTRNVYNVWKH